MKEPAISVQGLSRRFGELMAVDALRFDVEPGELFGLVGPDGAGKTTMLRMLAGVLRPSGGDALISGISVVKDPERVKHHIAYMSQRFGLYVDLTVRENIEFYADLYRVPHKERPARIERLFRFSNLGPFQDRLAGKLSGGMKQKLSLCCALIHQPDILLLDEPTFGVDPISRRDLWLILHEMVGQGVTVFVSTAYMDEAERCDHIALLDRGRIIALDQPENLQHGLAGRIVGLKTPDSRRAIQILEKVPGINRAALFGEEIHVTLASKQRDWPTAVEQLRQSGIPVQSVRDIDPSLEDVFMERVAGAGG
jgi:ABC-2 type transport system ATP-binding protein